MAKKPNPSSPCRRCKKFTAFYPTGLCIRCTAEGDAGETSRRDWSQGKGREWKTGDLPDRWFPELDDRPPNGIALETTPVTAAASDVFTPAELEARIAAHAERVAREYPALQKSRNGQGQ